MKGFSPLHPHCSMIHLDCMHPTVDNVALYLVDQILRSVACVERLQSTPISHIQRQDGFSAIVYDKNNASIGQAVISIFVILLFHDLPPANVIVNRGNPVCSVVVGVETESQRTNGHHGHTFLSWALAPLLPSLYSILSPLSTLF